jgi:uncharacterized protein YndB with AHSA1/START domain
MNPTTFVSLILQRMAHIHHQMPIKAEKRIIFEAITSQKGLSKWWTKDCIAQPVLEFVNQFKFGDALENHMKVIDLQPDKRVEWECIKSVEEWLGTRVIFEIIEKDGMNFLNFLHSGYENEDEFFASCNFNWARYLISLQNFCEKGKGSPFNPDIDLAEVRAVRKKSK